MPTWSERQGPALRRGTLQVPRPLRAIAAALLALLLLAAAAARPAGERGTTLVILSLDGVRHDHPGRVPGGAFSRLRSEGVRAGRLEPPFPASTFPAHATLATGCHPERHGILNSRFLESRRGEFRRSADPSWLECEPLWVSAERQGIRSGILNWPGSYGAWGGTRPSYHDDAFQERPDRETVMELLRWLRLPVGRRPRLIMACLRGVDHQAHLFGPDSAEVERRLRFEDRILSLLLNRVGTLPDPEGIHLVIVSDHGMAPRDRGLNPAAVLRRAGIRNRTFCSGGSANVYLERPGDRERARRVLSALAGLEIFPGDALPEDLRYRFPGRTGDLVLLAPVGTSLGKKWSARDGAKGGVHGHRGSEETMGGIFFGWGPAFRRGAAVERIRAVDLYPIACRLLGIRPSRRQQGRVPPGLFRTP